MKNNSVNTQTTSFTSFASPISNTSNSFGKNIPVTNANESSTNSSKPDKTDEKTKEENNLEKKPQSNSSDESKNISTTSSGFKLGDFKFNQQPFSTLLTNKSPGFSFNDKQSLSLNNPSENKSNPTPPFSFGTAPAFSFKPMEKQNDSKPFFSFGSKPSFTTPVSDPSKNIEAEKPKEEEDEDQPPVVNFTPVKENDAIFESKSKLFYLKNGKYEEHGVGQLYLKSVDDKKIQLIMRNDSALGTIMVNTLLNESVNFTKRNAKNVQLICVPDPTKSTKPQTVLFKFKDSQTTDSFENELAKLKK